MVFDNKLYNGQREEIYHALSGDDYTIRDFNSANLSIYDSVDQLANLEGRLDFDYQNITRDFREVTNTDSSLGWISKK
tara:strand:+ start:87961 stop:88194 length:234 start_codon:yes stop_codon:yes gene_type:complete